MSEKQMSPAEREARQMIADKKDSAAAEKAYNAASSVPPAPKAAASEPKKMAKGGTASSRADGCAVKGKTRGKLV